MIKGWRNIQEPKTQRLWKSEDCIDNQEFDTNEIVITVIGKRATQWSWDDIQVRIERLDQPGQRRIVFTKFIDFRILHAGSL